MARAKPSSDTSRKMAMIQSHIHGRTSASSSSLSASYGLPVEQVRSILRYAGVHDDG
ncbi:hypothetical protein PMI02_04902 [Novosphingobium sp. AP12]|nr:hypothetical protein PMI02_04902 [Novosphingobium sp. AP12]